MQGIQSENNFCKTCIFFSLVGAKVGVGGEVYQGDILNQTREINTYKGSGLIKRRQSDGKRERTQITLERIEETFFRTLRTAEKLERIEKVETFKAERRDNRREERRAKR